MSSLLTLLTFYSSMIATRCEKPQREKQKKKKKESLRLSGVPHAELHRPFFHSLLAQKVFWGVKIKPLCDVTKGL